MARTDAELDPLLEPRHAAILASARELSVRSLEPLGAEAERDLTGAAKKSIQVLAKAGLLAHVVPKAYQGTAPEVEVRSLVAAREGIAYACGLADAMFALQGLGSLPLTLAGSEEQRQRWLPKVAAGQAIAGFAMTEPEAGSDAAAMTTTATRRKDGWELTGQKTFISNAGLADFYSLFAKTDPGAGAKGVSCFLVPATSKGLSSKPLRMLASHPVGTLKLDGVRLPSDALVGAEGEGFKVALSTLDRMRPTVAAAACGFARRALDESVRRARNRRQFGKPIGDNQGLRWKLAEASTELEAARLLVHRAAWMKDHGQERITLESAQAKFFATETAQRIVDLCVQVHGGSGTIAGSLPERLYREVRALRIYEGTSEILLDLVARALLEPAKA